MNIIQIFLEIILAIILKKIFYQKNYYTYPYLYVKKGISKEDIMTFIGIILYMGIHKYHSIESYWNNSNLYTNIISSIMPKNYYFLLAKCLHFPEKEENEINGDLPDDNDHSGKINFFLEKLSLNFQKYYILGKNITIDESLLHFTGRNNMKFYIPI